LIIIMISCSFMYSIFILLSFFGLRVTPVILPALLVPTVGSLGYFYVGKPLWCSYVSECCNEYGIKYGLTSKEITKYLQDNLFGQHLVLATVPKLVHAHLSKKQPQKPLVLSFHGTTGVGKNYVSNLLTDLIYQKGSRSQFVHLFVSRIHFPHESKLNEYKSQLQAYITKSVKLCSHSLFIFDEASDLPSGLIDAIKPFLDNNEHVDGVDYRRAIFIFLSNAGTKRIHRFTKEHIESGRSREDIQLKDLEKELTIAVYNEKGGFFDAKLIDHNLFSAFIPFMPLQREHVRLCIKKYIGITYKVHNTEEIVNKVISQLDFTPEKNPLFSVAGCRRVPEKTDQIIEVVFS
jgi:torsin-1